MKTLWDIEKRNEEIELRMKKIRNELKSVDLDKAEACILVEEFASLLSESELLSSSLSHFQDMAETLLSCPCSGPH
jgi:hypothetical protein